MTVPQRITLCQPLRALVNPITGDFHRSSRIPQEPAYSVGLSGHWQPVPGRLSLPAAHPPASAPDCLRPSQRWTLCCHPRRQMHVPVRYLCLPPPANLIRHSYSRENAPVVTGAAAGPFAPTAGPFPPRCRCGWARRRRAARRRSGSHPPSAEWRRAVAQIPI